MTPRQRNISASVYARLLQGARRRGEDFNLTLSRYTAERFLFRLGQSEYRQRFVLKGAMLYVLWGGSFYRATRDLDFTGFGDFDVDNVIAALREICAIPCPSDGIQFLPETLRAEPIRDETNYGGMRLRMNARLGNALTSLQVDIGFGDAILPAVQDEEYPALLDTVPRPNIRVYPREAVVAEKLHAVVVLGLANSRMKDFYDLYVLSQLFGFEGQLLSQAIAATFSRRNTEVPHGIPAGLSPAFFGNAEKAAMWRRYLERNGLEGSPGDFGVVGDALRMFLVLPLRVLVGLDTFERSLWVEGTWIKGLVEEMNEQGESRRLRRKPYPAYVDSGVEWLGKIPAHWEVTALKRKVERIQTGTTPPTGETHYYEAGTVAWYGPGSFSHDLPLGEPMKYISDIAVRNGVARVFRAESSFVVTIGATIGKVAFLERSGSCNQQITAVEFDHGQMLPKYGAYQLKRLEPMLRGIAPNTTLPIIDQEEVGYLPLVLPPRMEQFEIAAFLDRETAKIDALVAKKERLNQLLQEKRTALITEAVTKGLNPDVPMKESGVEWLGEIPAHWDVKRLWHLTPSNRRIMYGIVLPGPNVEDGVPIVKGGDVSPERLNLDRLSRTTFEIESGYVRSRLRGGDLVFAIRGSIGEVAIVPDELEGANLTQDAARIAYRSNVYGPWLLHVLKSTGVFAQMEAGALGATIKGINIRDLKRAVIPVPPQAEQVTIAVFLDRETSKIKALIAEVRTAIDLLKELRSALISAAVTGKINVREEAA